jgi:hypothetical protein
MAMSQAPLTRAAAALLELDPLILAACHGRWRFMSAGEQGEDYESERCRGCQSHAGSSENFNLISSRLSKRDQSQRSL